MVSVRLRALSVLALGAACTRPEPGGQPSSSAVAAPSVARSSEPAPPPSPWKRPALEGLSAAKAALVQLARTPGDGARYLALRRGVFSAVPFLRDTGAKACTVLVGAETGSDDEGGGALGRLDAARTRGDAAAAARALREVELALGHAELEVRTNGADAALVGRGATRAAYDAGVAALGAYVAPPDDVGAATADYLGLVDAGERAGAALGGGPELGALVAELRDGAKEGEPLVERARRARATGRLGSLLRELAGARGAKVRPPYRAARDAPHVSALTLPAPRPARAITDLESAARLGAALFQDPRLSAKGDRSCRSCHDPALGWADGKPRPASLVASVTLRHTPSLLYAPLSPALLWDGRVLAPEDQALAVIRAHAELGGDPGAVAEALARSPEGRAGLDAAGDRGARGVGLALAAWEAKNLVPAQSPLDRYARGEDGAVDAQALAGLDVFAGKGRCARCHAPPVFGGGRPPDFLTPVFANVGLTEGPKAKALDGDRGRGALTRLARDEGRFKTPTVRGVDRSAPFFHNGAFPTLEDVVDFYADGGARGRGLDAPNQDPDVRKLTLTKEERAALLRFLRVALAEPKG